MTEVGQWLDKSWIFCQTIVQGLSDHTRDTCTDIFRRRRRLKIWINIFISKLSWELMQLLNVWGAENRILIGEDIVVVELKGGKSQKHCFPPHQKGYRRRVSRQGRFIRLLWCCHEFIIKESKFPHSKSSESKLTLHRLPTFI